MPFTLRSILRGPVGLAVCPPCWSIYSLDWCDRTSLIKCDGRRRCCLTFRINKNLIMGEYLWGWKIFKLSCMSIKNTGNNVKEKCHFYKSNTSISIFYSARNSISVYASWYYLILLYLTCHWNKNEFTWWWRLLYWTILTNLRLNIPDYQRCQTILKWRKNRNIF